MAARTRIRVGIAAAAVALVWGSGSATARDLVRFPLVPVAGIVDSSASFGGMALVDSGPAWARRLPGGGWQVERLLPDGSVRAVAASTDVGNYQVLTLVGAGQRLGWSDLAMTVLNAHDMSYRDLRDRAVVSALVPGTSQVIADGCPRGPPCSSNQGVPSVSLPATTASSVARRWRSPVRAAPACG